MSEPEELACELIVEDNDEFTNDMAEPYGTARRKTAGRERVLQRVAGDSPRPPPTSLKLRKTGEIPASRRRLSDGRGRFT